MILDELTAMLSEHPRDKLVTSGFRHPHSYRGYYHLLAFEPTSNVTVGLMLDACEEANGSTYEGWKGGSYTMRGDTAVYLAEEGTCQPDDEELSFGEVRRMLATPAVVPDLTAMAREVLIALYRADVVPALDAGTEDKVRAAMAKSLST